MKPSVVCIGCWLLFALSSISWGQMSQVNDGSPSEKTGDRYIYHFDRAEFVISHIDIEFDAQGKGKLVIKKKDEEEPTEAKLTLRSDTLTRLQKLLSTLDFINSSDTYQSSLEHPNLGTTQIEVRQGGRTRTLSFHYSPNVTLQQLANLFRGLALQEQRIEELTTSRRYLPLDTPKLLRDLEGDLKASRIAEPMALLELLKDLSVDEHIPLIARNHAKKLAEQIEKSK